MLSGADPVTRQNTNHPITAQISGHGAVAYTHLVMASSLGQETELEKKLRNRVKIIHLIIQLTNYLVSGFTVFICV